MKCGHCKTYDVNIEHVRNCTSTPGHLDRQPAPRPAVSLPSLDVAPEVGIYIAPNGGPMFKVQQSPTTGRYYAKQWDTAAQEWVYVGKAPLRTLTAEHKITAEQAKIFGDLTGSCVFCMRTLTDERSLAMGYGPVCAEHNGLPWGETPAAPSQETIDWALGQKAEDHACDFPEVKPIGVNFDNGPDELSCCQPGSECHVHAGTRRSA